MERQYKWIKKSIYFNLFGTAWNFSQGVIINSYSWELYRTRQDWELDSDFISYICVCISEFQDVIKSIWNTSMWRVEKNNSFSDASYEACMGLKYFNIFEIRDCTRVIMTLAIDSYRTTMQLSTNILIL